jgi:hypothetical protein
MEWENILSEEQETHKNILPDVPVPVSWDEACTFVLPWRAF